MTSTPTGTPDPRGGSPVPTRHRSGPSTTVIVLVILLVAAVVALVAVALTRDNDPEKVSGSFTNSDTKASPSPSPSTTPSKRSLTSSHPGATTSSITAPPSTTTSPTPSVTVASVVDDDTWEKIEKAVNTPMKTSCNGNADAKFLYPTKGMNVDGDNPLFSKVQSACTPAGLSLALVDVTDKAYFAGTGELNGQVTRFFDHPVGGLDFTVDKSTNVKTPKKTSTKVTLVIVAGSQKCMSNLYSVAARSGFAEKNLEKWNCVELTRTFVNATRDGKETTDQDADPYANAYKAA